MGLTPRLEMLPLPKGDSARVPLYIHGVRPRLREPNAAQHPSFLRRQSQVSPPVRTGCSWLRVGAHPRPGK